MDQTFWDRDRLLLREIVKTLETEGHGVDPRRVGAAIGMGHEAADQSALRLDDAGMFDALRGDDRVIRIHTLSEKGLRASEQWPASTEDMAEALLSALADLANKAPDPDEQSRLRTNISTLSGLSLNTLSGVATVVLVNLMGWG